MIKNNDVRRRSKHIDIKFHLIREKFMEREFDLEHVGSKMQLADCLTKVIGGPQLKEALEALKIHQVEQDQ